MSAIVCEDLPFHVLGLDNPNSLATLSGIDQYIPSPFHVPLL